MTTTKRKILITVITGFLLVGLYSVIFSFSAQDAEESGSLSRMISEKCVEFFNHLSGNPWSDAVMEGFAEYFEHPIRKLAHFCEYALMGVLLFGIWYPWVGLAVAESGVKKSSSFFKKLPKLVKIIVPWVFVSAAFDEIHQLFIPGRCGNIWDVLLDTTGGCFGLACCVLMVKILGKNRKVK